MQKAKTGAGNMFSFVTNVSYLYKRLYGIQENAPIFFCPGFKCPDTLSPRLQIHLILG